MKTSAAQQQYNESHKEFESWFIGIHPNHDLTFEWFPAWQSGWYKEDMVQGAWIAWLGFTGKLKADGLKLSFSVNEERTTFHHYRTGSEITVTKSAGGIALTFSDNNKACASLEMTQADFPAFEQSLFELDKKKSRDHRGFHDGDVVLSINQGCMGEPFEEYVCFTFTLADVDRPWDGESMSVKLDVNDTGNFLDTIRQMLGITNED